MLTGAGMSTESGLPDYRSAPKGMWRGIDLLQLASVEALLQNTENFYKFYKKRIVDLNEVTHHVGHEILAKWEKKSIIRSAITQNVDGFHANAGSRTVYELHGTLQKCHCHNCLREYSNTELLEGIHPYSMWRSD